MLHLFYDKSMRKILLLILTSLLGLTFTTLSYGATVPDAPKLAATAASKTSVSLVWTPEAGASIYKVYAISAGQSTLMKTLDAYITNQDIGEKVPTGNETNITGLLENSPYQFQVEACNSAGCSKSNITSPTTAQISEKRIHTKCAMLLLINVQLDCVCLSRAT